MKHQWHQQFLACQQRNCETLHQYSHTLMALVRKFHPKFDHTRDRLLKEQFSEGVQGRHLQRELKRLNRMHPQMNFYDFRNEAIAWKGDSSRTQRHFSKDDQQKRTRQSSMCKKQCFKCHEIGHIARKCGKGETGILNQLDGDMYLNDSKVAELERQNNNLTVELSRLGKCVQYFQQQDLAQKVQCQFLQEHLEAAHCHLQDMESESTRDREEWVQKASELRGLVQQLQDNDTALEEGLGRTTNQWKQSREEVKTLKTKHREELAVSKVQEIKIWGLVKSIRSELSASTSKEKLLKNKLAETQKELLD
jgi:hypothetical protein